MAKSKNRYAKKARQHDVLNGANPFAKGDMKQDEIF
jgi:hypothetical protein